MSILETFYILFKSDTTDVKKGVEEVEKLAKQTAKDLEDLDKGTQKVGKSFLDAARAAASFLGASYAAYKVFHGLTESANQAAELGQVSRALGVNVEQLDAWGKAVQRTGGSAQGFQQSLKGLAEHLGGSAQIALKVLPQLADVFQKIGRIRSFQYGKSLGLDESTILLLQQGRREVEAQIARQRELGVVTEKDTEIAFKYKQSIQETSTSFDQLYRVLARDIIPIFTKFLNVVTPVIQYLILHKDAVIGGLIGIGIAAAIMLAPFILANAAVIAIAAGIAALIALFAIAYEDVKAFLQGHESLTGNILKRWPVIGTVVGGVLKSINFLIQEMIEGLKFGAYWLGKIASFFSDQNLLQGLKFVSESVSKGLEAGRNLLGIASDNPLAATSSNSIFNSQAFARNQSINTGPITVNTQATSAPGVGTALGKGLQEHLWQANNEFADGVAY